MGFKDYHGLVEEASSIIKDLTDDEFQRLEEAIFKKVSNAEKARRAQGAKKMGALGAIKRRDMSASKIAKNAMMSNNGDAQSAKQEIKKQAMAAIKKVDTDSQGNNPQAPDQQQGVGQQQGQFPQK
jgi:hypothetical protein